MKLANRAYAIALFMLMLVFAVSAQTVKKSEKDDRNSAPTVGTGGPVGGPTGLFTVYDGTTLRKGEYTLSAALSNYDRDPGNVDISTIPLSFQIGVTNRLELFFNTEAYRGIKVNSPRNLSSFYLPNSQVNLGGFLGSPAAIVLAPRGPGASGLTNSAIFRPAGAPFIAGTNLFTGGTLGRMGFIPFSGPAFGFAAGTNASIGAPLKGGAADLFPGVGSVYGSLLPGIVLSTQSFVVGTTTVSLGTGPLSFSTAPTYLPDAPFVNRTYATSSFNSLDVGFKWRFNNPSAAWGHGISAFYRWYPDNANDAGGFNQMQRGAGPGSNNGDIGLSYFADARVTKWANVSGNVGYVYTSKIKGSSAGTEYTILDPADELHLSVGVDFPVNKFFQPILEFRSLRYMGGRTPNALENNPYDGLAGFRVYPRRWFGFGLAYRYNFNQQDTGNFKDDSTSNNINQFCGNLAVCQPAAASSNVNGIPGGLSTSSDPNGYIAQFWVGRRDKRQGEVLNKPANVDSVDLNMTVITLPCRPGFKSKSGACSDTGKTISVSTKASDPENDVLTYNYTVSGGRVVGTGANVQWDLTSAQVGTYTITTGVDDGCGVCGKTDTKTIKVQECPDCFAPEPPPAACPTVSVSGPSGLTAPGGSMTFTASATGDVTYNWSVSAGTISSGQGTPSITVSVPSDMGNGNVTATVDTSGPRADCKANASDTAGVVAKPVPTSSQVDEFGPQKDDEIKARVDNFYIQLNNDPSAKGFVIIYGTAAQIKKVKAQLDKAITFRKYDKSRLTFVDGPDNGTQNTKFFLVPAGATNPTP